MKTSIFKLLVLSFLFLGWANLSAQMIKTPAPKRAKGQTDVLQLATAPLPTVRVAFIGLGMRGPGHLESVINIPGVEVVALCDMSEKNTKSANEILVKAGFPTAKEYFGD
jgi:hypothetical protein